MFAPNSGVQLSENAVYALFHNQPINYTPILQIVDIRRVQNQTGTQERCRSIISDSTNLMQAMLATQINADFDQLNLAVIRVNDYTVNTMGNKKFVIITGMEILGQEAAVLGDPKNIDPTQQQQQQPQQQQQQQQPRQQGGYNQPQGNQGYQQPQQQYKPPAQNYPQPNQGNRPNNQTTTRGNTYQAAQTRSQAAGAAVGPEGDLTNCALSAISVLSPYVGRWVIKARVTAKGDIKTYKTAKSPEGGKLFNVDLVDKDGTEIRATMFNEQADLFHSLLQVGGCYLISRGQLKQANKKFSNIKNNYEITFDTHTTIQPIGDAPEIQGATMNYIPISDINNSQPDDIIDVIGILTNRGEITAITVKRTGQSVDKRSVVLEDDSGSSIELTLWGEKAKQADEWPAEQYPVVSVKGAKVSGFNGRTLSTVTSSVVDINPENERSYALSGWYRANNGNTGAVSLSSSSYRSTGEGGSQRAPDIRRTFAELSQYKESNSQDTLYSMVKGTINYLKADGTISYDACPNPDCKNKKVEAQNQQQDGSRFCNNCRQYVIAVPRYILSVAAADHTGQAWLSIFNDVGKIVFNNIEASDVIFHKNQADRSTYDKIIADAQFKQYKFKIRSKMETYNSEARLKHTVTSAEPLNYVTESKWLMDQISLFPGQQ